MSTKTSLKDQSIFLVLGNALTQGTTIIQGMVLARLLTQYDFGSFRQIVMVTYLFYIVFYLCIAESSTYYLASLNDEEKKKFLFQSLTLYIVLSIIAFGSLYFLRNILANSFQNKELARFFIVAALLPGAQMIRALTGTSLITIGRAKLNSFIGTGMAVLNVLSITLPLVLGASFWVTLQIYVYMRCFLSILTIIPLIKLVGITFKFDWPLLKDQFGFSLPYWISYATYIFYTQIHKVLVSTFFSPSDFALFSVASTELPIFSKLSSQIALVLIPVSVQHFKNGNFKAIVSLWEKSTGKVAIVSIPIFAFLFLTAREFLTVLYGPDYGDAWLIFNVMLLLLPLRICDTNSLFKITGKTKYVIVSSAAALVTGLASGWALLYPLGLIGPAIGVLIGRVTQIIITMHYIKKDLPITYAQAFVFHVLWKIFGISVVSFGAAKLLLLPVHFPLFHIIGVLVLGGALFVFLAIKFQLLDENDKHLIKRWITLEPIFKS